MGRSMAGMGRIGRGMQTQIHWNEYTKSFESTARADLQSTLATALLQVKPSFNPGIVSGITANGSREEFIRTATLALMSTPEYQLC